MKKVAFIQYSVFLLILVNAQAADKSHNKKDNLQAPANVYVRKNIYSLDPNGPEIRSLRKGVAVMQARSANDPTSWTYQAAMHGSYTTPAKANWNACQHGSFFFVAWHRMYLYYFERILRKASGDNTLTLPYWNYTDIPAQAVLPIAFRSPANSSNSLYTAQRDPDVNAGASLPPSVVSYQAAMNEASFATTSLADPGFGGLIINAPIHFKRPHGDLENQPHDQVHGAIGGWMADPNTAAQDPIFWLHHANIDRLWEKWIHQGGVHVNPTGSSVWMNTVFSFFDENGHAVNMKASQILDIAGQLDYKYDEVFNQQLASNLGHAIQKSKPTKPQQLTQTDFLKANNINTNGQRTDVMVGSTKTNKLNELIATTAKRTNFSEEVTNKKIILVLDGITYDKMPRGTFEVYINLPAGTPPKFNSIYYAGNIGLFGFMTNHGGGAEMNMEKGGTVNLDITDALKKLSGKNIDLSNIKITIIHNGVILPKGAKPHSTISGEIKIKSITISGLQ